MFLRRSIIRACLKKSFDKKIASSPIGDTRERVNSNRERVHSN